MVGQASWERQTAVRSLGPWCSTETQLEAEVERIVSDERDRRKQKMWMNSVVGFLFGLFLDRHGDGKLPGCVSFSWRTRETISPEAGDDTKWCRKEVRGSVAS